METNVYFIINTILGYFACYASIICKTCNFI